MGTEIERKFLVRTDDWRRSANAGSAYRQGYLARSEAASVRIRIIDRIGGRITIKSARSGLVRSEYEYETPLEDAEELLILCGANVLEKRRYLVPAGGLEWEVDVFSGRHEGLVLAEIELTAEDQEVDLPDWLGEEVTGNADYSNEALAASPGAL
jgi:adenylate cyclase